jgi:hypothetical protein
MGVSADKLRARAAGLHEFNGFRGVRLAICYPEIAQMQARAIFEDAVEDGTQDGVAGDCRNQPPSTTRSTSSVISLPAARFAS